MGAGRGYNFGGGFAVLFKEKLIADKALLALVAGLFAVGLVALYSAGGEERFWRQLWRGLAGIGVMMAISYLPPRGQRVAAIVFFAAAVVALLAVLVFGIKINNARRWLSVGDYNVQPSEFMKIALPLGLAFLYALTTKAGITGGGGRHILFLLITAAIAGLVAMQPDLGTAVILAGTGAATVFFGGIGWRWIAALMTAAVLSLPLAWKFVLKEYQKTRIETLFDPYQDALGSGYHTIQSQIAIGSGGVWGKGFLAGTQAQLGFLPERHTDFIFAVYAEEFGLAGAALLVALAVLLCLRCLRIAGRAPDLFGRLAVAGIAAGFFLTFGVNLCMVSGLLPVVGMPLPLVSYGGTSLLTTFAGFGIVLAVARRGGKV